MSPLQILALLFDLYISIVLVRFLLQMVRADFYNPLSQFVVTVTQPVIKPLRRLIPGVGGIDWASLIFAFALVLLKLLILLRGDFQGGSYWLLLLRLGIIEITLLILQTLQWCIIARAVLSWVDPYGRNPLYHVLGQLTDPILRPIRRLIPPIGGLDLSPMFGLLAILLAQWLVHGLEPGRWF